VPIGYIPAGSTNDFATSLGLSSNVLKAAEEIVQGTPQRFDVGSFGGRFFSYVASFGAFTRASYATSQSTKNMLGHTAYVLSGIQELSQLKTEHVRIELGDGTVLEDEFLFGAVSNSTSVGGILTLAPNQVDMADGELELLLVRAPRDIGEVTECILALQRQTYDCAMARFLRSNQVKVTASRSMDWTLDGEYQPGVEQVQIDCLRHAVAIIRKEGNK
jgi:diacylglycerol kinase family enzyme